MMIPRVLNKIPNVQPSPSIVFNILVDTSNRTIFLRIVAVLVVVLIPSPTCALPISVNANRTIVHNISTG